MLCLVAWRLHRDNLYPDHIVVLVSIYECWNPRSEERELRKQKADAEFFRRVGTRGKSAESATWKELRRRGRAPRRRDLGLTGAMMENLFFLSLNLERIHSDYQRKKSNPGS
jgi:hypothetical protein